MSKSPFDMVKIICQSKKDWKDLTEEEQKGWNTYMVNRILSMNPDYVELIDGLQSYTHIPVQVVYKLYCDVIPKSQGYFPWIKSTKAKNIDVIAKYFSVSNREAREYQNLLSDSDLQEIIKESEQKPYESKRIGAKAKIHS